MPESRTSFVTSSAAGVVISVRVIPRAAKSSIAGVRENALLVRLKAPPVDGAANDELIAVLAEALGVGKRSIGILSGHRDRRKTLAVAGVTAADVERIVPAV